MHRLDFMIIENTRDKPQRIPVISINEAEGGLVMIYSQGQVIKAGHECLFGDWVPFWRGELLTYLTFI